MAEVVARDLRFHVQRLGRGSPPVVFLHGLVMDNLSSWYFALANAVATEQEVVLYDLRGHGLSERPPRGYGVLDMVADLAALLDALGLREPVHLVGNSFGGLLAVAAAIAEPARVRSLVLVDPHLADGGFGVEMQRTLSLQGDAAIAMIAKNFAQWKGRHSARKRNKLAENARELIYGTSLLADLAAAPEFTAAQLAGIRCPVLTLFGEHSDVRAKGEQMLAAVPGLQLRVFPACTHSILWEQTAALKAAILDWLAGLR